MLNIAMPCAILAILIIGIISLYYIFLRKRTRSIFQKHVLITGGSSGIGKAAAIQAAQKGANVTIVARNEQKLKEAVQEIRAQAINASEQKIQLISTDIAKDGDDFTLKLDQVVREAGPVYVLVNCAGTSVAGRFEELKPSDFRFLMDVNYFGSVNVTRAVLPQMKAAGEGGSIVFVSSMAGLIGLYGFTAYTASKYAIRGFAEALEMELKPFGIDVSVNFPPDTDTPGLHEEEKTKPEETKLISGAAGLLQPDEVAR